MFRHEVVVTGIGLATPMGDSLATFAQALFAGGGRWQAVRTAFAEPVAGTRMEGNWTASLERSQLKIADASSHLALLAGARAVADAGLSAGGSTAPRGYGVYVGCGSGPTESVNRAYAEVHSGARMNGLSLLRCMPAGVASAVALQQRLTGPNVVVASACASSALAIGEAMRAIRHGYLDGVLAGGTEAPFGDVTVKAWEALRVLAPPGDDPARACRPFDRGRQGLALGEGAAFFMLESAESAAQRGATVHAVLSGFGASADAHHWTEPHSDGQVQAMRAALADAGKQPGDIDAINAHGTGTVVGDRVEAVSIATVFGAGPAAPPVYSSKPMHGHTLGASGAIELAAVIASLRSRSLPPTRNLTTPDDLPIRLVHQQPWPLRAGASVLSNSFAFGGSNACLIVSAA